VFSTLMLLVFSIGPLCWGRQIRQKRITAWGPRVRLWENLCL
jgi:hypothetical protein